MSAPEPIPAIPEPTVISVTNRAWSPGADEAATYDATRGSWRVGAENRGRAVYALGVAGGIVRGAFRNGEWHPGSQDGLCGFEEMPAPELAVVGTSVERLAPPKGAANSVRRCLEGIPPSEEHHVRDIACELNAELLAGIMYGQRELFHSNLLAWIFDGLPDVADAIFWDFTDSDPQNESAVRSVEREKEDLDLVMRWPSAAPLVIENKKFSLPERQQLDEYRGKTSRWMSSSKTPPTEGTETAA